MYEPKYHPQFNIRISHPIPITCAIDNHKTIHSQKSNADPLHIHSALEILFFHNNEASFLLGDNLLRVPRGSAVISKPNEIHMCIFDPEKIYDITALWIDTDLSDPIFCFLNDPDYHPLFRFDDKTFADLTNCLQSLDANANPLMHFADIIRILALFESNKNDSIPDLQLPNLLQNVICDINQNLSIIQTVSDLMERHYISQATLNRYFQKHLHISAQKYLLSQKLLFSAQLLTQGCSVTEACIQSGFTDCSRFIVQFKREFSVTPKQYQTLFKRKQHM